MVDRVDEAVGAQGVAKLWCELGASFDSVSFREVDDCKISETHKVDPLEQGAMTKPEVEHTIQLRGGWRDVTRTFWQQAAGHDGEDEWTKIEVQRDSNTASRRPRGPSFLCLMQIG